MLSLTTAFLPSVLKISMNWSRKTGRAKERKQESEISHEKKKKSKFIKIVIALWLDRHSSNNVTDGVSLFDF